MHVGTDVSWLWTNSLPQAMTSERPYDIYRDSNVPEVLKCRPLLTTMRNSVKKLLNEWPEHPTLQQVWSCSLISAVNSCFYKISPL